MFESCIQIKNQSKSETSFWQLIDLWKLAKKDLEYFCTDQRTHKLGFQFSDLKDVMKDSEENEKLVDEKFHCSLITNIIDTQTSIIDIGIDNTFNIRFCGLIFSCSTPPAFSSHICLNSAQLILMSQQWIVEIGSHPYQ